MKTPSIKKISVATAAAIIALGGPAFGSTVNILWYTGGAEATGAGTYEAKMNALAAAENSAFNVSGSINTWNITYWTGGAKPVGTFNVLVAASREGSWSTFPNYTSLLAGVTGASFGDRVMLTGQDADWHDTFSPGSGSFNGPAGFLIDAINWAGSGTGMGGVLLSTGVEATLFPSSTGLGDGIANDTVNIPAAFATFPINAGLTSAGLSNWGTSAHDEFDGFSTSDWTAINVNGNGNAITLVSKATASGGTSVPDSGSTFGMLFLALVSCVGIRHMGRRLSPAVS